MTEIDDLHNRTLEWGCVCTLIDKIGNIEETIPGHWDELIDMIANMIEQENRESDPSRVFFNIYQYCFRLYYRLRANHTKRKFNQISAVELSGEKTYRITNYDYKTFKWANENGFVMGISNDYLDLPANKLTDNQRRAFDRRIGE